MTWIVAESYPVEELVEEGVSPANLRKKWEDVAEDMALIPDRNVKVTETAGVVKVEVSEELYDCMSGR